MSFLVFITVLVLVYVVTFKKDFTQETIDKAFPFVVAICTISIIFSILENVIVR